MLRVAISSSVPTLMPVAFSKNYTLWAIAFWGVFDYISPQEEPLLGATTGP
jgi:hypothetical protein